MSFIVMRDETICSSVQLWAAVDRQGWKKSWFKKNIKNQFFLFKSDFFDLNQIFW